MTDLATDCRVALGCWPIAGITSIGTSREESLATLRAALDAGVTHFDTAHAYGYDGESERMVGEVLRSVRDEVFVASKAGLVWGPPTPAGVKRLQSRDGHPETLKRQCAESLSRLGFDAIDLFYLHAPDPNVPIADQAGAMKELVDAGHVASVGVSNFQTIAEYEAFAAVCPVAFDQEPYNLLQRGIETTVLPWTSEHAIRTAVYWPLMKGLLAGRLSRDHQFDPSDSRSRYDVFQGERWQAAQDVLDVLREIAGDLGATVAQLVVAATLRQHGIDVVLCGAKRAEQIRETALAARLELDDSTLAAIDLACQGYRDRFGD